MNGRSRLLAATIANVLIIASTYAASDESIRGKMVDRSTSRTVAPTANMEFDTSLDGLTGHSDVRVRDLELMRKSVSTLPREQATEMQTLSDADQGALFESGRDELLPSSRERLTRIAENLRHRSNLRILVIGHADAQRLSPATRKRFENNQKLSEARAYQVAQFLRLKLALNPTSFTIVGKGDTEPVASNATPEGMARNRRVELQVWYDVEKPVTAQAPVDPERSLCSTSTALSAAPMSITVDGRPLEGIDNLTEADHQRCVDVAVNRHDIQIQFDPLKTEPALNITAWPSSVVAGKPVELIPYSNYVHWIRKAEVRFFLPGQDTREQPLAVVPMEIGSSLSWTPDASIPAESAYVLRVYDEKGRFDETAPKPLTIVDRERSPSDLERPERERLTGYGESALKIRNISVSGGSVTVSGRNVAKGTTITALGSTVPVDDQGRFVIRQLLPSGRHSVLVESRRENGEFEKYRRNIELAGSSWFYVALGELTAAKNNTTGPAQLVTQDTMRYEDDTEITGRGAFYAKGKIDTDWLVTLSADTREQPIEDLFSNFASKDPRYLLERIDAERAYPVYGDDSSSEWDAPTNGRFYLRVDHKDSRAVWGNFQTSWTGLELNQFSRGLYGADVLYKSESSTSFGERRVINDLFAAEPGTLNSREEFRGTGGSLYYLRRQDITRGSERLWIEVRDPTSGITLQRAQLIPGMDYELSYLQGRVLLRAPLSSIAESNSLVQLGSLSGNHVYLVATYEYAPGLNELDSNVYGVRHSSWLTDHVRVGLSGYEQGESADKQRLGGLDMTLRFAPATYLDLEAARSEGVGSQFGSIDGGFGFNQNLTPGEEADAFRAQGVFDLAEFSSLRGRGSVYWQNREAGFSGAGALVGGEEVEQLGAALSLPIADRVSIDAKTDRRDARTDSVEAQELALHYQTTETWSVSVGGRHDDRQNAFANASPLLSQNGQRTDAIVRIDYKPLPKEEGDPLTRALGTSAAPTNEFDVTRAAVPADFAAQVAARPSSWQAYGFAQATVDRTGTRDENNRGGLGAEKQLTDRFRVGAEVSEGTGGVGGKLTGDYRLDDRANVYFGHTMETERQDSSYRGRFGNTVLGARTKLSDQVSIYDEARNARGAGPESLTNAFGVDLAPNDRWTFGITAEVGTVSDPLAGDLERRAGGFGMAYKYEDVKFTSNLEYRDEQGTNGERKTWLARNTAGFQVTPDWRLLGKVNVSFSEASAGNFFDGDFVDAALGGAYRPVGSDRWNTLVQYRYYYTLPSPGQVGVSDDLLDYAQRSHVVSIDTIYDVLPWLSFGTKYAQRLGELRDTRIGGEWYSSRADLTIFRADLHLVHEWDAVIEGRRLTVKEADDSRSGVLAAVYRHLNAHVKLGAGYNFTDFSDDLTDLSYRSRGPFINILSTF
ncbi:OmpA family protein [Steroidobacter sp. S1-65]|uniref:OmpA family protein n=1 Tax=Steroidobacter gossypii TaxID=2805490 RepID=A0ABS1WYF2_9GAMM|nr:OmpA family protein [Steroidobacter gossypii]MBM0106001.1 OmpA family protein [Steroidobacter gossypii]